MAGLAGLLLARGIGLDGGHHRRVAIEKVFEGGISRHVDRRSLARHALVTARGGARVPGRGARWSKVYKDGQLQGRRWIGDGSGWTVQEGDDARGHP